MKIAIISSAHASVPADLLPIIDEIICELSKRKDIQLITGGCLGIPGLIVTKARMFGIRTIAYSPDSDEITHAHRHDNLQLRYFDEVHFYNGFTQRSLAMIQECDGLLYLTGG